MVNHMKKCKFLVLLLCLFLSLAVTRGVSAQSYRFTMSEHEVEAYINADGTLTLYYYMAIDNMPNGDPIDFIDVGLPSTNYDLKSITATVDDKPITGIGSSAYVSGIELPLKGDAIQPGNSGIVIVTIGTIRGVLYPYDEGDRVDYVNFQFSPNYIDSQYEKSTATKYRVTIILPPGVGTDEGVYYTPSGWLGSTTPDEASTTTDGRVYYSWYTENANVHTPYYFGAAFPAKYVESSSVIVPMEEPTDIGSSGSPIGGILATIGSALVPCGCVTGVLAFIGFSFYQATVGAKKRKLQYLPPKIAIEGHGIKRGLTAVEAAILMEEPMDKVLTMIMFGTLKKGAATVLERDPLKLEVTDPLPEGLHEYETGFLSAFKEPSADGRRRLMQTMMVDLVKSTSAKMKGFSRKETVEYYKSIIQKAWNMVEEAQTPEVKSEQYDRTMEWTMLDKEYEDRTRRTFTGTPVFLPSWWYRYDPVFRETSQGIPRPSATTTGVPTSVPIGSKPSLSLPNIPGSDFAASVINGTSAMAAGVVGNLTSFTSGVTTRTNPIPVTTSSSSGSGGFRGGGGGGHSCACACACAGCACACAGGGR